MNAQGNSEDAAAYANRRVKELMTRGMEVMFDAKIPLHRYQRSAGEVYRMAKVYQEEGNLESAFMLYNRHITLMVERIPKLPEYAQWKTKTPKPQYHDLTHKVNDSFNRAEKLKKRLIELYKAEHEKFRRAHEEEEKKAAELAAAAAAARAAASAITKTKPAAPPSTPPVADLSAISYPSALGEPPDAATHRTTTHRTDWVPPTAAAIPSTVTPSAPPLIDRSSKPGTSDFLSSSSISVPGTLRRVVLPQLAVDQFMLIAEPNSNNNKETCGFFCGVLQNDRLTITHLLIPRQTGTSDSCAAESESEIKMFTYADERGLLLIGWIHTHPSQTAFLSSIDMHTQQGFQVTMDEFIGVVVSPKYKQTAVFNLTREGLTEITDCRESGHHLHESSSRLFQECTHCDLSDAKDCELVDLR